MGRGLLRVKNYIKGTALGKRLRDLYQARGFTRQNALLAYEMHKDLFKSEDKERIVSDMLMEARKYRFGFDEYFMYHFYKMPVEERRTYIADRERTAYCEKMNRIENMIIFDDKALTYKYYGKYYHRDLIGVLSGGGNRGFAAFFAKHPKFIVKPFDGACGVGIKIVDGKGRNSEDIFAQLRKDYPNGCVAEELIIQTQAMAKLHPQSVNTLRITTIRYDDHVDIIHPFMRTGRGEAVVDNGGSGGIICALDPATGRVIAAADEVGRNYDIHPDTKQPLVGFDVPRWDEAVNLVKELAYVMPEQRYMGWDLALTDNGWVMQEANDRGAFVGFQLPIHKGFRGELEAIMKELKL